MHNTPTRQAGWAPCPPGSRSLCRESDSIVRFSFMVVYLKPPAPFSRLHHIPVLESPLHSRFRLSSLLVCHVLHYTAVRQYFSSILNVWFHPAVSRLRSIAVQSSYMLGRSIVHCRICPLCGNIRACQRGEKRAAPRPPRWRQPGPELCFPIEPSAWIRAQEQTGSSDNKAQPGTASHLALDATSSSFHGYTTHAMQPRKRTQTAARMPN